MKDEKIFYYEGKPVYAYSFRYTDDMESNLGYNDNEGGLIATEDQFEDWRLEQQGAYGFSCWNITRRYATEDEYKTMVWINS